MSKLKKFKNNENPFKTEFSKKLNLMVDEINRANNISLSVKNGRGSCISSPFGHSLNISLPLKNLSSGGGGGSSTTEIGYFKVKTSLSYDPGGSGAYVVWELESDGTDPDAYVAETTYSTDDLVNYNSIIWRSKIDSNTGNTPAEDANWEEAFLHSVGESGNIDRALSIDTDYDLRDCIPWFEVNAVVPYVTINSIIYILHTLNYAGDEEDCSLRWNENEVRAMAVFK